MFTTNQTFKIRAFNTFHNQFETQVITVKSVKTTTTGIQLVTYTNDVIKAERTKPASFFTRKIIK